MQRIAEQETPAPAPAAITVPVASGISFKDMRAVGVTIAAALFAFVGLMCGAMLLPGLAPALLPIVLLAVGFLVPAVYRRNSRQQLTSAAGARLGWMTGVWFFLGVIVLFTLVLLMLSTPEGADMMRQLQSNPQFAQMKVASVRDLANGLLVSAIPTFLLVTLLPGLGGMLGARFWKS